MAAHDHSHEHEEDNYYLDQLCMIAISAAFGGVCLALYFLRTAMLRDMLAPQFHSFVLWSGLTLVVFAVVRAANLWIQVGQEKAKTHDHQHHDGDCCHDHEHAAGEDHHHDHDHGHGHHHHDHDAADHDHSWAPWRYVVLMVPLVLFALGLPRKGREAENVKAEFTAETFAQVAKEATSIIGFGTQPSFELTYVAFLGKDQINEEALDYDFKKLDDELKGAAASSDPNVRAEWKDKAISVVGKFAPSKESQREFGLIRYRISCCASDAFPVSLPVLSRQDVNIPIDTWVKVTGRVEFRKRQTSYIPVIVVYGKNSVTPCPPDPNPYIQ